MSWSPKKLVFGSSGWTKYKKRSLVTSGYLLFGKLWWPVWIGSFRPKIEVFYRPGWTRGGTTWKWIFNVFKFRNKYYKQLDWKEYMKNWGHFSSFHVPFHRWWSLNCLKKCIFCNFALTSARNLCLLKQFIYMHLEDLVDLDFLLTSA